MRSAGQRHLARETWKQTFKRMAPIKTEKPCAGKLAGTAILLRRTLGLPGRPGLIIIPNPPENRPKTGTFTLRFDINVPVLPKTSALTWASADGR